MKFLCLLSGKHYFTVFALFEHKLLYILQQSILLAVYTIQAEVIARFLFDNALQVA